MIVGTAQLCGKCHLYLAKDQFSRRRTDVESRHQSWCVLCTAEYHASDIYKAKKRAKRATAEERRKARDWQLRSLYGISLEQFDEMLKEQGGVCKLCRSPDPGGVGTFHVDHCHATMKIRGLLCCKCNVGVSKFCDSPELLRSAANYLEESRAA